MNETKFKETEVSKIPRDWRLDKLKDNFEFKANNTLPRDALSVSGTIQDVHYGDVLIKFGPHLDVPQDGVPYISDIRFKAPEFISDGDVIIADTAEDETVGKATEVLNVGNNKLVSGLHTMWLHPVNQENYALGYLGYAFNASIYHNQLLPLMQGTKVTSISKAAIKDTFILVPPKTEQARIATALSNVDAFIAELDRLIEKKRAIRQGAMQQLLTGKKRLKGFSEPWVKRIIGDIADVGRGRVISQIEIGNSFTPQYPVYSSQTSNDGIMGFLDTYDFDGEYVTWTTDGVNAGTVFYRKGKFNCTNVCGTLQFGSEYSHQFMAMRLGLETAAHVSSNLANPKLMNGVMESIVITLPPSSAEQFAIASVLSAIDEGIAALEAKRDKYVVIKQGMMQQLLTGKIRLVDA